MSLSSRARYVAKEMGWPYQKALRAIKKSGERPRVLARKNNWSLRACDLVLANPYLKPPEWKLLYALARGERIVCAQQFPPVSSPPLEDVCVVNYRPDTGVASVLGNNECAVYPLGAFESLRLLGLVEEFVPKIASRTDVQMYKLSDDLPESVRMSITQDQLGACNNR